MCETIDVCRICLENEDLLTAIFPQRSGIPSVKVILFTTGIEMCESDSLPYTLCQNCLLKIENANQLRQRAEQSDLILKKIYKPFPDDVSEPKSEPKHDGNFKVEEEFLDDYEMDDYVKDKGELLGPVIEENKPEPEVVVHQKHSNQEFKEMKFTKIVLLNKFEQLPTAPRKPKVINAAPKAASHKPIIVSKDQIKKAVFPKQKVVWPEPKTNAEVHPIYVCELCGKEVKRKVRYIEHMNTHTNSRPYHCHLCSLQFNAKNNLTRHLLTHSGEKPYKCNICGNSYRATHHLKYHKLQKHGTEEDRKFICHLCPKSFVFNNLLNAHMKDHFQGPSKKLAKTTEGSQQPVNVEIADNNLYLHN